MKLKCIGGPMHGVRIDCPNPRIGDGVQVREARKVDINTPIYLDPHKMAEMVTDIIHLYVIENLAYKDNEGYTSQIWFLRYPKMGMWEAVKWALT